MSVHKVPVKGGHKWEVRYRDDTGRNRSRRFERKLGRGGADEFDDEMANARRSGETIDPDRDGMPLAEFYATEFLETYPLSPAMRKRVTAAWAPKVKAPAPYHLGKRWGKVKLRDVNRKEAINRWHAELKRARVSDASVRTAHNVLVMIVGYAVEMDFLSRSRIEGYDINYEPQRYEDVWLPATVELIRNQLIGRSVSATTGTVKPRRTSEEWRWARRRDAELVSFMGYQATRPGEACALPWSRVLNAERTGIATAVWVRDSVRLQDPEQRDTRERTKNGGERHVPLETAVREDLRSWWMFCGRPTSGLVFPRRMSAIGDEQVHWTTSDLSNWRAEPWTAALTAVGLPYRPPKHLRHSCVSMWIRERLDRKTVADRAGHSMDVLEKTYAHAFATLDPHDPFRMSDAIAAARGTVATGLRAVG